MAKNIFPIFIGVLVAACLTGLSGCSSGPDVKKVVALSFEAGVPGGTYLETYQTTVRIVAIDAATRKITFTAPDGSQNTFHAGPKFSRFDTCHVGDEMKVSVARELAMYLGNGIPPSPANPAAVVRSAPDVQPGVLKADTQETKATVVALDLRNQEATLHLANGRDVTFKVRKDVDLSQVPLGSPVTIRTAAAMAVLSEKP